MFWGSELKQFILSCRQKKNWKNIQVYHTSPSDLVSSPVCASVSLKIPKKISEGNCLNILILLNLISKHCVREAKALKKLFTQSGATLFGQWPKLRYFLILSTALVQAKFHCCDTY